MKGSDAGPGVALGMGMEVFSAGVVRGRGAVALPWARGGAAVAATGATGVLGLTLVGDLGQVARVALDIVGDLLEATVGQVHEVVALGVVSIAGFRVAVVVAGGGVINEPVEVIVGGSLQEEE